MAKRFQSKVGLDIAMTRANTRGQEIDDDILDLVATKARYSRKQNSVENPSSESPSTPLADETSKENVSPSVVLKDYPLNTEVDLDPMSVTKVFKGNRRNTKNLRNIRELAESIIESGRNTEPVKVRRISGSDTFELIKGVRRWNACKLALTLTEKPVKLRAIISDIDDHSATVEAAMENIGRDNLNPWDQADQLKALMDMGVCSKIEDLIPYLPPSVGKRKVDRSLVYFYLLPSQIPPEIRSFIDEEQEVRHATIKKLKQRIELIPVTVSQIAELLDRSFRKSNHTVQEIMQFLESQFDLKLRTTVKRTLIDPNGKPTAEYSISPKGVLKVTFTEDFDAEQISKLLELGINALNNSES